MLAGVVLAGVVLAGAVLAGAVLAGADPAPVTVWQPVASTVTGCRVRPAATKTRRYPPPVLMGQLMIPCGMAGSPQMALARARAFAGSRTVIRGATRGSGLDCSIWVSDGIRVTRTTLTAAGLRHTGPPATGVADGLRCSGDWRRPGSPPRPGPGRSLPGPHSR